MAPKTRSSTGSKKPLKDVSNSMNTRKRSSQKKNATKKTKAQPAPAAPAAREPSTEASPTLARAAASLLVLAVLVSQTLIWLAPSAAPAAAPAVVPAAAPKKTPLPKLAVAAGVAGALAAPHFGTARAVGSALMMTKEIVPIRSIAPIFTAARRGPVAIILSIWRFVRGIVGFAAL